MNTITRVGVDLAKYLIQVHAVDAAGKVVTSRALKREKFLLWCTGLPTGCLIAMEACSGSHHWSRKLMERGFDTRIIPGSSVAPYRIQGRSGKNVANDAEAVCEAASRPHMNFVPTKTLAQQGMLCVHLARGACGAINESNSVHGATKFISSRNTALPVRRVLRFKPSSCRVMTPLFLSCLAHAIRA